MHIVLGSTRSDSSEVVCAIESPLEGQPENMFEASRKVAETRPTVLTDLTYITLTE